MISFIVIGRNEGWKLKVCFDALSLVVSDDKIHDCEIIYVDSKSTDNSIELAKRYGARVFLITGECNAAIARNIGAKEAVGDILFFIDGDMELFPGFLPNVLTQDGRLEYPFISGIFNDIVHDLEWNYLHTSRRHKLQEGDADIVQTTTGGLFLIEHSLWKQVNGLDTRLKIGEDYDIGLRLTKLGIPLQRKAILLANHYMRQYVLRNDYVGNVKYTALLLRKHWKDINYLKIFIMQQYTTILLLLSILFSLVSPWLLLLYVVSVAYKDMKQKKWKRFWAPFVRDVVLLWALIFFWPPQCELKYMRV